MFVESIASGPVHAINVKARRGQIRFGKRMRVDKDSVVQVEICAKIEMEIEI